ncbi:MULTISPECIES: hypothetical protein [unclassified Moorena]|uniref:hypothetical protein n=1 Tax=unclassified Moorena TaxID=2683338 RepID=UPI0013C82716|nr:MULTISPECIES: hypothetical protein [unclassified Moorena]NEO22726.1 hypothetical protein [Moorena sp. SIO4A5]
MIFNDKLSTFYYTVSYSYEVHRIFYLLPLTCSLLPAPCSLKARTKVPHDYDNCYIPHTPHPTPHT